MSVVSTLNADCYSSKGVTILKSRKPNKRTRDRHHLCFPRHDWNKGYCHMIRSHWYCIVRIPKYTLHPAIHYSVPCIPAPFGPDAKKVYNQILELEAQGLLSPDDPIEKRLGRLMNLFAETSPGTSIAFQMQLDAVRSYKKAPR